MRRSLRAAVLALAVVLPLGAALTAQVPPGPTARVTDMAGILPPEDRRAMESRLAAFERETTHQIAVLTIPSLEGEPIETLSHRVATTWKLGRAGVDNGVLLLIAVRDRRARIEVGYGLEPSLPDGLAGAIIREAMAPRFRQGDFVGGTNAALDRVLSATRNADLASVPIRRAAAARRAWGTRLAFFILLGLALFGLAHFAARQFMGKAYWALFGLTGAGLAGGALAFNAVPWRYLLVWAALGVGLAVVQHFIEEIFRCPKCSGWLRRQIASVPGDASHEAVVSTCPRCRFRSRVVRAAAAGAAAGAATGFWFGSGGGWSGGGGGGGGDSGFSGGGGDFGGGGASGDW